MPCRDRKEGERQQLADLVGKNLTYISQLEGLDFKLYKVSCSAGYPATYTCILEQYARRLCRFVVARVRIAFIRTRILGMNLCAGSMQDTVQGRMMEQVVSCKDEIAQQYLMQCIIQGFPDEFHLGTLTTLLSSLPELQSGVKVHLIVASLLDRLTR